MTLDEISKIQLSALRRYLEAHSWKLDLDFRNKNVLMYINDLYGARIALPASEHLRDYIVSINNSINALSDIEERTAYSIINDIQNICVDRIEFRIVSDSTANGTIPLDYAAECVDGIKELVLYSAAAEIRKTAICPRPSKDAYNTLQSFSFAQTSIGSFVFNINTQVVESDCEQLSMIEDVLPRSKNREVVSRIQTAIKQVQSIAAGEAQLSCIAEKAFLTGITANMCEALIKIRPNEWDASLHASFKYATAQLPENNHFCSDFCLAEKEFLIISELAKFYYDEKLVEFVELTGFVRSLSKRGIKDTDAFEKVIRLQANYDEQERTIRIELSDEYYVIACNAHRDGIEVRVAGDLDMSSRLWTLSNIKYFIQVDN